MAEKTKTEAAKLQEQLIFKGKNGAEHLSRADIAAAFAYCEGYKAFMNSSKTEREAVRTAVALAEQNGFKPFDPGARYNPGDRVYSVNRGKAVILAVIGQRPVAEGVNIIASHVDVPRVDFKPRALYEEAQLGLFKTHYYGGIKKYQWTAIPLAIHGVAVKADGTPIDIVIGEDPADPVFCITDLLPHLAADQMKRTLSDGIKGEELNILAGTLMHGEEELQERVKLNLARLIYEKYGLTERELISADIEVVPAFPARDLGLDRSMVGAYGHDDRVCAYTSLTALLGQKDPQRTAIAVLADREEIGSEGATGLRAAYLRYFVADLAKHEGADEREVLRRSRCLSADVGAAFDPTFGDVNDKRNSAYLGYGVNIMKYVGSRGKAGTNEATAEYTAEVLALLDERGILWQVSELGSVDKGGGGTVAMYIANLDVDTIDIGVPVLSMHAPFEVVSKLDVHMAHRAFSAFWQS